LGRVTQVEPVALGVAVVVAAFSREVDIGVAGAAFEGAIIIAVAMVVTIIRILAAARAMEIKVMEIRAMATAVAMVATREADLINEVDLISMAATAAHHRNTIARAKVHRTFQAISLALEGSTNR